MLFAFICMTCFQGNMYAFIENNGIVQVPSVNDKSAIKKPVMVCQISFIMCDTVIERLIRPVNTPRHPEIIFGTRTVQPRRPGSSRFFGWFQTYSQSAKCRLFDLGKPSDNPDSCHPGHRWRRDTASLLRTSINGSNRTTIEIGRLEACRD